MFEIDFIIVLFTSILMAILTSFVLYEILYYTWKNLDKISSLKHRYKIFAVIISIFTVHTICVWLYGIAYYLLINNGVGSMIHYSSSKEITSFLECVYFSAATYSSLGFGDIIPKGVMQFLTGVQVLNGLILIGWSASFTYLSMEKFWQVRKG